MCKLRFIFVLLIFSQVLKGQSVFKIDSVYRLYFSAIQKGDELGAEKEMKWLKDETKPGAITEYYLTLSQSGNFFFNDETEKAFSTALKAIAIAESIKCDSLVFKANYKIGSLYMQAGNLIRAYQYFNKCLLLLKSVKNIKDHIVLYSDIATVHSYLGKKDMAIEYYPKMVPLIIKTGNRKYLGKTYNNIGISYVGVNNFIKGLYYYRNSIAIGLEVKDEQNVARVNNNLGTLYYVQKQYNLALEYFLKGSELREKSHEVSAGLIESNTNIGKTYNKLNQTTKAIDFLENAREGAINEGLGELERRADEELYVIYGALGQDKKAFELQSRYFIIKDSLFGLSKREEIGRLNFESKLRTDSLASSEVLKNELAIHDEKERRSALIKNIFIGGFLMVVLIAIVLYKQVKRINPAHKIIEQQKSEIEIKQKEVIDSIYYARRIQRSILTTEIYINKTLDRLKQNKNTK